MKKVEKEELPPLKVTDLDAIKDNLSFAVECFAERWQSLPELRMPCEIMDQGQLRDAMGLRASMDYGDPWPEAERLLLKMRFRWHQLGDQRVMFLREREDACVDDGWSDGEEIRD